MRIRGDQVNTVLPLTEAYLRGKYPLTKLLSPQGGLMSGVVRMGGEPTSPDFNIAACTLGNMHAIFPHLAMSDDPTKVPPPIGGAGADIDPELAWIRAAMEAAERYACLADYADEFIIATASELGSDAMDLDTVPRCSSKEYADPKCPFKPVDKNVPIRWVRGYSLIDQCYRMVPVVMTHLGIRAHEGEQFWNMISTGVAAHFDLETALNSAICESIERDAIAMTWLARLPLPKIQIVAPAPAVLGPNLGRLNQGLVQHHFFDATTDMGVPTIYAVQVLDGHPHLAQYVNCATDFNAAAACAKTIREAAPARPVFEEGYSFPADFNDFAELHDGAAYMGRPELAHAYEFLLKSANAKLLSAVEMEAPLGKHARLQFLLNRLRAKNMDAIVVDLTTDELRALGIWVVRVVIPGLMPMSTHYRGRFLGHQRLYDYPASAGYGRMTEADINPFPQPFA
jgi:ribosomal protein S12 methylthiotransferase accessory factor